MAKKISILAVYLITLVFLVSCSSETVEVDNLVGSEAPAFRLGNAAGGETSLKDYSGQPVLLYFHMAVG